MQITSQEIRICVFEYFALFFSFTLELSTPYIAEYVLYNIGVSSKCSLNDGESIAFCVL